jgi:hypothetical protein
MGAQLSVLKNAPGLREYFYKQFFKLKMITNF